MPPVMLIERRYRFSAGRFTPAGVYQFHRDILIDGGNRQGYHFAAVVTFGYDTIRPILVIRRYRRFCPRQGTALDTIIRQEIERFTRFTRRDDTCLIAA